MTESYLVLDVSLESHFLLYLTHSSKIAFLYLSLALSLSPETTKHFNSSPFQPTLFCPKSLILLIWILGETFCHSSKWLFQSQLKKDICTMTDTGMHQACIKTTLFWLSAPHQENPSTGGWSFCGQSWSWMPRMTKSVMSPLYRMTSYKGKRRQTVWNCAFRIDWSLSLWLAQYKKSHDRLFSFEHCCRSASNMY